MTPINLCVLCQPFAGKCVFFACRKGSKLEKLPADCLNYREAVVAARSNVGIMERESANYGWSKLFFHINEKELFYEFL